MSVSQNHNSWSSRGERQWATDRLSPCFSGRLNILLASISSPISSPAYYEKALRKRHNVITFGPYRDRSFWEGFASTLKTHYFYKEGSAEHWVDVCSRLTKPCDIVTSPGALDMGEVLKALPPDTRPDLFIWVDQHNQNIPLNLDGLNCPKVAIFGDTHLGDMGWRLEYALNYDYVFVSFNRHHADRFRNIGCRKVYWSPAACAPDVYCKIPAEKIYPVSFVGSTHPYLHRERVELLEFLRNKGVDIFIDSKLLLDMSLIFSRSRIVLNRSIADDLNQRVFETLGTGSLLFTNRVDRGAGLEELFKDREHLVIYDDRTQLVELIEYYLKNDMEREKIAYNGYKEVLSKHTYDGRVRDIINTVREDIFHEYGGGIPV